MSIRKTMLAAALAAFAFAAMPAIASAQPAVEGTEPHFTLSGGASTLTTVDGMSVVSCTGVTGTGEFEGDDPWTTGVIEYKLTGCKASGTSCGTKTAGSGEIDVGSRSFHLVTTTDATGGEPVDGFLITPTGEVEEGTGEFASFKCAFGLVTVQVNGTGTIGEIENYALITNGTQSNTLKIDFAVDIVNEKDTQTYEMAHYYEQAFGLEMKVGASEWKPTVYSGTWEFGFTNQTENTLIEEYAE